MTTTQNWFIWALLSAVFAALTAIFAKVGLERVNSDFATLIRTAVIRFAQSKASQTRGRALHFVHEHR